MAAASLNKETGGCLFGSYDRDHNIIYVYYMVPAPEAVSYTHLQPLFHENNA